jgi:hypothetical protein
LILLAASFIASSNTALMPVIFTHRLVSLT